MPHATITQVATRAGVSIKSVSRVINQEPHVTSVLRAKVEQAIKELGYVPNAAARSLAGTRAFAIAVLFDNPSPAYIMKVQEGAYAGCRRSGHQLVIEHIDSRGDVEQAMRAILRRRIDGVVLTPPISDCDAVLDALEKHLVRYVRLAPSSHAGRSHAVGMDDRGAAAEVARHLAKLGHRRFGLINGPASHGASGSRRAGFLGALGRCDAISVSEASGEFSFASGMRTARDILAGRDRPTAVFAANDDMAAGVYAAAAQLGLTIGCDLSVVGFDDSWIAQSVWPELTTVYQPIAEMADAAVSLLIDRAAGSKLVSLTLKHRLMLRDSTGRLAGFGTGPALPRASGTGWRAG